MRGRPRVNWFVFFWELERLRRQSLWLPYGALGFNSAEGRVGGAFDALWEGPAGGRGGVWRVIDRWRGGVYSASIGRMGAGAASSLKIANALLFPPRNSQESYLWIKRGCETSQRWTLHNNDSTQNKQLWQNNSYSNIKNTKCHYKIKEQCFEPVSLSNWTDLDHCVLFLGCIIN